MQVLGDVLLLENHQRVKEGERHHQEKRQYPVHRPGGAQRRLHIARQVAHEAARSAQVLRHRAGQDDNGKGENQRYHPRRIDPQGNVAGTRLPVHLPAPENAAPVLHRNPPVRFVEHHNERDDQHPDDGEKEHPDEVVPVQKPGGDQVGEAHYDAGKDNQRYAVANAPFRNQLAQPHQEHRAGGHRQHRRQRGQQRIAGEAHIGQHIGLLQQRQLREGLRHGNGQRAPVGNPVQLDAPRFAFPRHRLQLRNHRRQQLDDDGRRDVGKHPQGHNAHPPQRAAGEQVQKAQQLVVAEQVVQLPGVQAGDGNVRHQPVEGQHPQGEQDFPAQVGQAERVNRRLQQPGPSARALRFGLNHNLPRLAPGGRADGR